MPSSKSQTIYKWKKSGLICDDYNALYETYIETTGCQHCKTEFTEKNWRCMDHDHETGLFRKMVCHRCNVMDSYIKYPNGYSSQEYYKEYRQKNKDKIIEYSQEYYQANKERISAYKNQKIECDCGSIARRSYIAQHKRSKKHSLWVQLQA